MGLLKTIGPDASVSSVVTSVIVNVRACEGMATCSNPDRTSKIVVSPSKGPLDVTPLCANTGYTRMTPAGVLLVVMLTNSRRTDDTLTSLDSMLELNREARPG